jgi:hypothetical protein
MRLAFVTDHISILSRGTTGNGSKNFACAATSDFGGRLPFPNNLNCLTCSRELSQLDVKMATLYDTIVRLVGMGVRGDMQDQRRAWLQERAVRRRPRLHPQALRHAHAHARGRGCAHRPGMRKALSPKGGHKGQKKKNGA